MCECQCREVDVKREGQEKQLQQTSKVVVSILSFY